MEQKLRAMLDARRDPDFFIVARTDAIAVTGLKDAIDRLEAYARLGVDGLYADAPDSIEHLKEISSRLKPYGLRNQSPAQALEESYFALAAALAAEDEAC